MSDTEGLLSEEEESEDSVSVVPVLPNREQEETENLASNSIKQYLCEIIESVLKILVTVYLLFGILVIISRSAFVLNPNPESDSMYEVIVSSLTVNNVIIFVLTIISTTISRSFRIQMTGDRFYFFWIIIIPLSILSMINILLNYYFRCEYEFEVNLSWHGPFADFLSIISAILVCSSHTIVDPNKWFKMTLIKFVNALIVVCCSIMFALTTFMKYNSSFQRVAQYYLNISFKTCVGENKTHLLWNINHYILSQATLAFSLFIVAFLLSISYQTVRQYSHTSVFNNYKGKIWTIFVSVILVILSLVLLIVMTVLEDDGSNPTFLLLNEILLCLISLVGIACCVKKIQDVLKWKEKVHLDIRSNVFDRAFIWCGFLGQLLLSSKDIGCLLFYSQEENNLVILWRIKLMWIVSLFSVLQTLLQTYLVELTLNREWCFIEEGVMKFKYFYPSFLLISVNISYFSSIFYMNKLMIRFNDTPMVLILFFMYLSYLPQICVIVQRLHGMIFFIKLYLFTERSTGPLEIASIE